MWYRRAQRFPPPVAQRSIGLIGISKPIRAPATINPAPARSVGRTLIAGKVRSGGKGEQDANQQYGGDHQGAPLVRQSLRLTRNDTEFSAYDATLNTDGGSELVIGLQRAVPLVVAPAIIDNKYAAR